MEKAIKLKQRVEKNKEIGEMVKDIEEEFNEGIIDEYHKLASELGYSTPQIVKEKLLKFLKKNNLKVYDRLKVEAFLDGQYGEMATGKKGKPGWCWVSLTGKQNSVNELRTPNKVILAKEEAKRTLEEHKRRLREKEAKKSENSITVSGDYTALSTVPLIWYSADNTPDTFSWSTATGSVGSSYSGDIESGRTCKKEIPMRVLQLISAIKKEIPELSFFVSDVAIPKPDPFLYVACEGMEGMVIAHWDEPNFVD